MLQSLQLLPYFAIANTIRWCKLMKGRIAKTDPVHPGVPLDPPLVFTGRYQ